LLDWATGGPTPELLAALARGAASGGLELGRKRLV